MYKLNDRAHSDNFQWVWGKNNNLIDTKEQKYSYECLNFILLV